MGNKALREIDASNGQLGGRDTVNVGRILGMVDALLILGVLAVVFLVVLGSVWPSPRRPSEAPAQVLADLPAEARLLQRVLDAQPLGLVVDALGQVRQRGRHAQGRGGRDQDPVVGRQDALLPRHRHPGAR